MGVPLSSHLKKLRLIPSTYGVSGSTGRSYWFKFALKANPSGGPQLLASTGLLCGKQVSPSLLSILLLLQDHDFSQPLSAKGVDYQLDMIKVQLFYLPREKAKKRKGVPSDSFSSMSCFSVFWRKTMAIGVIMLRGDTPQYPQQKGSNLAKQWGGVTN